jgi:hypothetical protein
VLSSIDAVQDVGCFLVADAAKLPYVFAPAGEIGLYEFLQARTPRSWHRTPSRHPAGIAAAGEAQPLAFPDAEKFRILS